MIDSTLFKGKKILYATLGCKLNFAETSTIGRALEKRGAVSVKKGELADICIINTCSVTDLSDKKCRQTIRRLIKNHPGAVVVVTGCYAQLKPEEVSAIDGVDLVLGNGEKLNIESHMQDILNKVEQRKIITTSCQDIRDFAPSLSKGDDRTRYFLKIQDGCNYYCSYCTVPFARGNSRNGSIDALVKQAYEVADSGGKEIVLSGVNIGDFGKSTNESFFDLIRRLDEVEGIERFRISSIEPNLLKDEIIEFVAASKRFAPHFHIPLQSGSDAVLKLMRRRYDTALFAQRIGKIKTLMPDAFVGVDVIVGMRGETDAFFEESYRFIDSLPVSQLHVFSYSERPGTDALKIDHVVSPEEKQLRSIRLLSLSKKKLSEFYDSQVGRVVNVLFEHTPKNALMCGFSGNYVRVEMPYDETLINRISRIVLEKVDSETGFFKGLKVE
ncbi:MAG: tRNA (N(6)-L-threonylcarbamoyladenosine(37)-C(2))-methylthiotransferase MtaB [Bacteroidales bacterium]|nr:tRNA (N(6)-L-threonylcarbamoyladenosine(37)-C(2))-methylthiotransferase MtaB [Bacteroidales bacterium]